MIALALLSSVLQASEVGRVASERWTMMSEAFGEQRSIDVFVPREALAEGQRLPVLYVLDGSAFAGALAQMADWLVQCYRIPPLLVVGIESDDRLRLFPASFEQEPGQGFLAFFADELTGEVERRYPASSFRIVYGHSLGGLFALRALAELPGTHAATIAISPALDFNGGAALGAWERALDAEDWPPTDLFFALSAPEREGRNGDLGMPRALQRLEELLRSRAPPRLRWKFQPFPEEDHGTVALAAAYRGLQWVFEDWRPPEQVSAKGMAELEAYYAGLSRRYGFRVPVPEYEIRYHLDGARRSGNAAAILDITERASRQHPGSPEWRASLADALSLNGRKAEAVKAFEEAVALAREAKDPELPMYQGRLEAAQRTDR
jgi:predicted alpha/beta superfamily hydrolase